MDTFPLRRHWPEYLMEAAGLGLFMVSAALCGTLLEHPASPLRAAVPDAAARRVLMGLCMGLTAVALIYCPWGRRSGAHLNPAVTLAFLRLGKIAPADAVFYVLAQFAGGAAGLALAALVLGAALRVPEVNWIVTVPGARGAGAAFVGEIAIAFVQLLVVLLVSNTPRLARFTGVFAASMVATWIGIEAPLSGMSLNPARTVASALPARTWTAWWIYFIAPVTGMLLATSAWRALARTRTPACAKLHHDTTSPCIFRCAFHAAGEAPANAPTPLATATAERT